MIHVCYETLKWHMLMLVTHLKYFDCFSTKLRIRFPQRIKIVHHHHTTHHYAERYPYGAPIPPHFRSRRRYQPTKPPVNFRRRRPPPPPKSFYGPANYASRYRNWRPYREKYRDDPPPYYNKHYHEEGDDEDHYLRASASRRPRPKRPSYPDHYPPYDDDDDYDSDHEYSSHHGSKYLKDYDDDEDSSHESSIRNYRKRRRNKKRNRPEFDHSRNYNTNHQKPVNQYAENTRHFTNTYVPHPTASYGHGFQNNQGFGHGFPPGLSISESSQTRTNQHDDLLEAYQAVSYSKKQLPVYHNTPQFFRNYDLKRSWGTPETSVGDHDIGFGEGMEEVDGGVYVTRDLSGI